ncbi:MAG: GGDEF domain-containing protein [Burkholderiaceae bacterium]|nr:GGDEF domain-containing protein [Burkholderiaceae bacterium]
MRRLLSWLAPVIGLAGLWVLVWMLALLPAPALARALLLDDAQDRIDAWPALTRYAEPDAPLSLAQVQARAAQFTPPDGARGALGLHRGGLWLRLPLQLAPGSDGQWVLDIAYPPLNRVDVHLVAHGQARLLATLGNLQPHAARPLASRTLALPLQLLPELQHGGQAELWLRVQTQGAVLLPISLAKPRQFHQDAAQELLLQGLLGGLGLFLVLYSLMQWAALREPLFATYAWLTSCSVLFSVFQMGLGSQLLWPDQPWIERHAGSLLALLASAGSSLFIEHALRPHRWPLLARLLRGVAVLQLCSAAAHAAGLLDVHQVSRIIGTLGLLPPLLGLPGAIALVRQGSGTGLALLLAWIAYFVSTAVMVGLIGGRIDAGFWSLHSFQIGATLDMLLFMRVISLRQRLVRQQAQRAAAERELLLQQAHTDALTGLANRRGLQAALARLLPQATPQRPLALFLLDLDGFKAVNDGHGHDTGDALLVRVAQRLRAGLRHSGDVVARLGGDEFVVIAGGLAEGAAGADDAQALGHKLAALFEAPFELADGRRFSLGSTLGWVLAPHDGHDAASLLQRADAAMYQGKQGGRARLQRWSGP